MERPVIYIPVSSTNEVVSVPVSDLPSDADELLEILAIESAPLSLWIEIAKAYLTQGRPDQYEKILDTAASSETEQFFCNPKDSDYHPDTPNNYYPGVEYDRIQILCSLADYHTKSLKNETNFQKQSAVTEKATALITRARKLGFAEQLPRLMDAQLTLAKVLSTSCSTAALACCILRTYVPYAVLCRVMLQQHDGVWKMPLI